MSCPRVYLRRMDTGSYAPMEDGSALVDLSTSVYPLTSAQWSLAVTSSGPSALSFVAPSTPTLSAGYYLLTVMANAVPSDGRVVYYTPCGTSAPGYATKSSAIPKKPFSTAWTAWTSPAGLNRRRKS